MNDKDAHTSSYLVYHKKTEHFFSLTILFFFSSLDYLPKPLETCTDDVVHQPHFDPNKIKSHNPTIKQQKR